MHTPFVSTLQLGAGAVDDQFPVGQGNRPRFRNEPLKMRRNNTGFRALRAACGEPSPTVLNRRLKELREAGLVDHDRLTGYHLTRLGRELLALMLPLSAWSEKWVKNIEAG